MAYTLNRRFDFLRNGHKTIFLFSLSLLARAHYYKGCDDRILLFYSAPQIAIRGIFEYRNTFSTD